MSAALVTALILLYISAVTVSVVLWAHFSSTGWKVSMQDALVVILSLLSLVMMHLLITSFAETSAERRFMVESRVRSIGNARTSWVLSPPLVFLVMFALTIAAACAVSLYQPGGPGGK